MLQFAECWIYCTTHSQNRKCYNKAYKERKKKEIRSITRCCRALEFELYCWLLRRVKILTATRTRTFLGLGRIGFISLYNARFFWTSYYIIVHTIKLIFYRNTHNFKRMWELKIIDKWCWWIHSFAPRIHSLNSQQSTVNTHSHNWCKWLLQTMKTSWKKSLLKMQSSNSYSNGSWI